MRSRSRDGVEFLTSARGDRGRFARLGLHRAIDFALHLPLRYEDLTRVTPLGGLIPGISVQVRGVVSSTDSSPRRGSNMTVRLSDGQGEIALRFLHAQPWIRGLLLPGRTVLAHGLVRGGLFGLEMVHPTVRADDGGAPLPDRLTPIYPTVAGIGQSALRTAIRNALREADLGETIARDLVRELSIPDFSEALKSLHTPVPADAPPEGQDDDRQSPPWRRIILDELIAQQLALVRARSERDQVGAAPLLNDAMERQLLAKLPFRLTSAQARVVAEIGGDLGTSRAMHRLLQGDVGSGKTVVAALAAARAIGSGWQVALMAPTEILAEQHWLKLRPWLETLGVRVAWLTGSLRGAAKRAVRAAIASGEVDLAIGTHALVEETTAFPRLGLAIVDEQHRFGVAQRLALVGAESVRAHLLMMSATPIPRTLAMSYCADLDLSVIDELPPGRSPVVTRVIDAGRRDEVAHRVRQAVVDGRQAYWVCPLVEESETMDLKNASETAVWLSDQLPDLRVGLVHGRLPASDKAKVMADFQAGTIDVLVSTTVIEVGVDVPNASLMVIEHAERFGLAQLHQLRGRVGRGSAASACVLLASYPISAVAKERLGIIRDTQDGFEIARRDLLLRGPGEFLGARQSGLPMLRFADLERDADLLEIARHIAGRMLVGDALNVNRHLDRWLSGRTALATV
ncbi:MAG: ATP-dependent DNA helicase RecG [Betaproteobacteria bacterium]|nr:ATP-dependent DNA helicase RecG [Betaproteobacteria bacterium]